MYLRTPKESDAETVLVCASECGGIDVNNHQFAGSERLAKLMFVNGYLDWLSAVRNNRYAMYNTDSISAMCDIDRNEIEPGYVFIVVDEVEGASADVSKYLCGKPTLPNGDVMVGIVTLKADKEDIKSDICTMCISVLPSFSDTASYMRIIQNTLTHIVCVGLPFRVVKFECMGIPEDSPILSALEKCNFSAKDSNESYCSVDLSVAHQLKRRIQDWKEREE